MGNIFTDLFSSKPAEEAAAAKKAGINAGLDAANPLFDQALVPYTNLLSSTTAGSSAYGDATGANGAEGLSRAKSLFTATPGYQSGFDLLTDANDRRAASRGMLNNGNTIADTTKLATTYADQNYGNYVSRLAPYLGANSSAAAGNAGVLTGKAGLNYNAQTGIGNANADAETAKYGASGNFWNALMGIGNLATKAFTGGGGGSAGGINLGGPGGPVPFY